MPSEIVINATLPETRICRIKDGEIADLSSEFEKNKNVAGNIYKGKVSRVLPGMQAAFVNIGLKRAAFLYVGDTVADEANPIKGKRGEERENHFEANDLEIDPAAYLEDKNLEHLENSIKKEGKEEEKSTGKESYSPKPRSRRKSGGLRRNQEGFPRIQDLVQEGQEILVQVTKEEMGTKGARLTCHIAIPGRHVVLMPTIDHVGISRKIAITEARNKLRDCIEELRPPGMGFIIRTMASQQSTEQITNEVNCLLQIWANIKKKFESQKAPSLIHEDLNIILRTVRDNFTDDIYRLVVDSPRVYEDICKYVEETASHLKNRIVRYTGKDPIFDVYGINSEISLALNRKVWLKNGGYLIVDQAEALTVIDVNTGKFIGKKSLEETILKTNLEAVVEVAYQLRLRDAGGIIIIDLIDMEKYSHREQVYRALEQALRKDKAKTNILRISELGLIQMTRKRTKESLNHTSCEPCPYCRGNGFIKSNRTICYDIFREIERIALEGGITGANVVAHPQIIDALYQKERDTLARLEERFGMKISIREDTSLHLEAFEATGERLGNVAL